ncbi:MAG: hypothetical protein NC920_03065, partial [Candidatus Omnitrophica bacterium]|nr:hypothetical protein [Candidatus Omnitrophota bacterium]
MKKTKIKNQIAKFKDTVGILNTKEKITQAFLKEKLKERKLEEKKWVKSSLLKEKDNFYIPRDISAS